MKKFSEYKYPVITAMLKNYGNIDKILSDIKYCLENGAEAFGFEIGEIAGELRTKENFKAIIEAMGDCPCYITDYIRRNVVEGQSDEELYAEMKLMVECGAVLVDLRGDMFCPTEGEITNDPAAIERQKQAVLELHSMGVEVLMSTHTLKYIPPSEVMEIARLHKSRGVDITKIVIDANTKDEQRDAFINTFALQKEFGSDFLFLCNGTECYPHRVFAPFLSGGMYLCSGDPDAIEGVSQPPLKSAVAAVKLMCFDKE